MRYNIVYEEIIQKQYTIECVGEEEALQMINDIFRPDTIDSCVQSGDGFDVCFSNVVQSETQLDGETKEKVIEKFNKLKGNDLKITHVWKLF